MRGRREFDPRAIKTVMQSDIRRGKITAMVEKETRVLGLFSAEEGALMIVASTMVPRETVKPETASCALISAKICSPKLCASSRWRNVHAVVLSGTLAPKSDVDKSAHDARVEERFLHRPGPPSGVRRHRSSGKMVRSIDTAPSTLGHRNL